MHISEGILAAPILAGSAVVAAAAVAVGLHRLHDDDIPRTAVLTAAYFVASLIHVPIGFTSAHLVLNGLMGILLGWAAFPAILIALFLQALVFGFGGLTVLGVNTLIMAAPAVICAILFRAVARLGAGRRALAAAAAAVGALAIVLSALLAAIALATADRAFAPAAVLLFTAHIPIMVTEALITAGAIGFLSKVRPEAIPAWKGRSCPA